MAAFKYPLNINSLNQDTGMPSGSDSPARFRDILSIGVIDSTDTNFNPYNFGRAGSETKSTKSQIYLYMPSNINANYSIAYQDLNLGVVGANALGNFDKYSESTDSAALGERLKSLAEGMMPEVAMGALGNAIGIANQGIGLGGDQLSGSDVSALTKRKAFNPYTENVFKGVGFRKHSFTFKLISRSKQEADEIKGIINVFKEAMHPDFDGGGNRFLTIPDFFSLKFLRSGSSVSTSGTQILYKFKLCVLESLNVNYTPDGFYATSSGWDGSNASDTAMGAEIQLSFKETQIITKKDLDKTGRTVTF